MSVSILEKDVLDILDQSKNGAYNTFIWLGDVYSYLIDSRLNIFRNGKGNWAIAAERLGYNPRGGAIELQISYYGNCLINLEEYNGQQSNYYVTYPIDHTSFAEASGEFERLNQDVDAVLVRGVPLRINHDKAAYESAGITLKEIWPNVIGWEEAGRLLVLEHRKLFCATDEELYKSIPNDLEKILVIDEWYHRDFELDVSPDISEEQIKQAYEFNKTFGSLGEITYEEFSAMLAQKDNGKNEWNSEQLNDNRPSTYETWQLIAKVISANDAALFKPARESNTHWKYWEESGSL